MSSFTNPYLASLPPDRAHASSPFRVDEGFSEDTRSQAGSDTERIGTDNALSVDLLAARQWLSAQSVDVKLDLVRDLLSSLPNRLVSELVREANGRLHFDPITCLPREIVAVVFECLDSQSILTASLVSKAWRAYALEPFLWRRLFALEGWTRHERKIPLLESGAQQLVNSLHPQLDDILNKSPIQDGVANRLFVEDATLQIPKSWLANSDASDPNSSIDMQVDGVATNQLVVPLSPVSSADPRRHSILFGSSPALSYKRIYCPLIKPSRLRDMLKQQPRVNWQYLYEQRKRLEQNWASNRFTNFRLPHPDHPREAHTQCVYTIQFSGRFLASGSRDQTIRIWDLDTQRLALPPLHGHTGSVLCLQFDERPEHDILVSGGSDSDVVVWRFSTGQLIKRLAEAHSESVLNLRFDERYLVTCSKDKTIKLWNRKALTPSDPDYPVFNHSKNAKYPDYIVNVQLLTEKPSFVAFQHPLPEYSLLITFEGHGAAVNAVQICKDQIVSASGDRKIMLWDIRTGRLVRQITGHHKGIACVQYDGRRIVSGSSDNTVRIFDSSTAAEVAVLDGHRSLVRTVQAEFGDIPGDEELLEAEARENDRRILAEHQFYPQTAAGSQKHFVYGAKLPPGGGGNRWSKIISGSYDETVIIWRKDDEGKWVVAKELRQEDAMEASAVSAATQQSRPMSRSSSSPQAPPALQRTPEEEQRQQQQTDFQRYRDRVLQQAQSRMNANRETLTINTGAAVAAATNNPSEQSIVNVRTPFNELQAALNSPNVNASHLAFQHQYPPQTVDAPPPHRPSYSAPSHHNPQHPYFNHQSEQNLQQQHQQYQQMLQQQQQQYYPAPQNTVQYQTPPQAPPHQQQAHHNHHHHHHHHHQHNHHHAHGAHPPQGSEGGVSRVFKLQFDARRIVCCSQQPVIVGWDFANGDRDIIEASQFFGDPR